MHTFPLLHTWPPAVKKLIFVYALVAFLGVVVGGVFIEVTTRLTKPGIVQQYRGNKSGQDGAEAIKFPKPYKEMLTIIHNHILGLSPLFLITGLLYLMSTDASIWKTIIAAEPLVSLLLTFGGLWVMRFWWTPFVYVVMISGVAMLACYGWMSLVVMINCLKKNQPQ